MNIFTKKAILFFFIILYCSSFIKGFKEWWEDSKVFELTNENFFEHVGKDKYVVVKFYTRWCGYCRIMAPEYDSFHESLEKSRDDVLVARLEGSINEDISSIYEIHSFPKIVLFEPNSPDIKGSFSGNRVASKMEKWVNKVAPKIDGIKKTQKIDEKNEEKIAKKVEQEIAKLNEEIQLNEMKDNQNKTEEIEYVRRELDNMKNKIVNMELEINSLKNYTIKLNAEIEESKSAKINQVKSETVKENKDNSDLNDEMKIKLKALNEKKAQMLESYSIGDYILYFCIFLFFIGAIITIRKVFFISNKTILPVSDHPKV